MCFSQDKLFYLFSFPACTDLPNFFLISFNMSNLIAKLALMTWQNYTFAHFSAQPEIKRREKTIKCTKI